jgi:hypothetical protein
MERMRKGCGLSREITLRMGRGFSRERWLRFGHVCSNVAGEGWSLVGQDFGVSRRRERSECPRVDMNCDASEAG